MSLEFKFISLMKKIYKNIIVYRKEIIVTVDQFLIINFWI